MDIGSAKPIDSVGPDEELINQVVPDEEELFKEEETSPTPTLGSIPVKHCDPPLTSFRSSTLIKLLLRSGSYMPWAALRRPCVDQSASP